MMKKVAIQMEKMPGLDLHGEKRCLVSVLVNEYIFDNYKMNNKEIRIIHGKSTNILTKEVHSVLKDNKLVKSFKLNNWNLGETIVYLK